MKSIPVPLGFKYIEEYLESFREAFGNTVNYPPFNFIKLKDENSYVLEMATAGFDKEDLKITLKNGLLTISGEKQTKEDLGEYFFRSLAARSFSRSFRVAEDLEVSYAEYNNGVLKIGFFMKDNKEDSVEIEIV